MLQFSKAEVILGLQKDVRNPFTPVINTILIQLKRALILQRENKTRNFKRGNS
jgi:hypothetical protein